MAYNNNSRFKRQENDDNNLPQVFQRLGNSSRTNYNNIEHNNNNNNSQRYDDEGGLRIARYNSTNSSQRYPDYSKISKLKDDAIYYTPNNTDYNYKQPISPTNSFRFVRNDDTSRSIISFVRDIPTSNQSQQQQQPLPPTSPTTHNNNISNNNNNNYNHYTAIHPSNNNNNNSRTIVQETQQEYQEPEYQEQHHHQEPQEISYNDRINMNIAKKIQITASIPPTNHDQTDTGNISSNSNPTNTTQIITPKRKVIVTIPERERSSSSERKRSRRSSPSRNKRTRSPSSPIRSRRPRRSSTVIYDSDEEIPFLNLKADYYIPKYADDDDIDINSRLSNNPKKFKDLRSYPPLGFVESHHKVWTNPSSENTLPLSKKFTPGVTKNIDVTQSTTRSISTNCTIDSKSTQPVVSPTPMKPPIKSSVTTSPTNKPVTTPVKPVTSHPEQVTTSIKFVNSSVKFVYTPITPVNNNNVTSFVKQTVATPIKQVATPVKPTATPIKPAVTTSVKPTVATPVKVTTTTLSKPTKSLPTKPISFTVKSSSKQIKPTLEIKEKNATTIATEKEIILNDQPISELPSDNIISLENKNKKTADNNTTMNSITSDTISVKQGNKKQSNDVNKAEKLSVSQEKNIISNEEEMMKNKEMEEKELGERAKNLLRQLAIDERDDIVMDIPSTITRIIPPTTITPNLNNIYRQCNRLEQSDNDVVVLKEEPISDDIIMSEQQYSTTNNNIISSNNEKESNDDNNNSNNMDISDSSVSKDINISENEQNYKFENEENEKEQENLMSYEKEQDSMSFDEKEQDSISDEKEKDSISHEKEKDSMLEEKEDSIMFEEKEQDSIILSENDSITNEDVNMSEREQDSVCSDEIMPEKHLDPIFSSITNAIQNTMNTIMGKFMKSSITEKINPIKPLPEINTQDTVLNSSNQSRNQLISPPTSSHKEKAPLLPVKTKPTSSKSKQLPPGWKVRMTDSGEILYRDPQTGKETTSRPVW